MESQESQIPEDQATGEMPRDETQADGASADAVEGAESDNVEVGAPDFQDVADDGNAGGANELKRFQDIKVVVSADLGRATVPIQTLMNLGEGSVLELNREIDSPVELVAQGVPLASGEVVVVNGCFAVRITQVYENKAS